MGIPGKTFITSEKKRNQKRRLRNKRFERTKTEEELIEKLKEVGCKAIFDEFWQTVDDYRYHRLEELPGFRCVDTYVYPSKVVFVYMKEI